MTDKTIELRLQGAAQVMHAGTWRLWLEPAPPPGLAMRLPIDPRAPIAWRELERLRSLTELEYQGTDPTLARWVRGRPRLRTLRWLRHRQARIDLARTKLTDLAVDADRPLTLSIPPTLRVLRLLDVAAWRQLRVETDDDGARLAAWVWSPRKPVRAIAGLPALRELSVGAAATLDLALVAKHPGLRRLDVIGVDSGIAISHLRRLRAAPALKALTIRNAYHTDFAELPSPAELPGLETLELDGVRAAAAALIRDRWRGFAGLTLRGVRTDAWLRANADNPFRAWAEEYGPALGRRATRAYQQALRAIDAGPSPTKAEALLRAFVGAFNAVEDQIDTIMREEIDDVYAQLVDRLGPRVSAAQATAWFDAWREF